MDPYWTMKPVFLLRMAEDAAFVIGVVKFGAVRSDAPTDSKKYFSGRKHAHRWCYEIDPEGVPIAGVKR